MSKKMVTNKRKIILHIVNIIANINIRQLNVLIRTIGLKHTKGVKSAIVSNNKKK